MGRSGKGQGGPTSPGRLDSCGGGAALVVVAPGSCGWESLQEHSPPSQPSTGTHDHIAGWHWKLNGPHRPGTAEPHSDINNSGYWEFSYKPGTNFWLLRAKPRPRHNKLGPLSVVFLRAVLYRSRLRFRHVLFHHVQRYMLTGRLSLFWRLKKRQRKNQTVKTRGSDLWTI